jgi:hypothetical protein
LIKDNDIEHYDIGIEFIEMLQKDRKILAELIVVMEDHALLEKSPTSPG